MNHLTDEQFEDIMQGNDVDLAHLKQCPECRARFAEKQAIAGRLRSAFSSIGADADLAERIRSRIEGASEPDNASKPIQHTLSVRARHKLWPALAAAAAVLVVLVPLSFFLLSPSEAMAGQAELVEIHRQNIGPHREFYSDSDPEKLAEYFTDKLGFSPAFLCTGQGMAIRGCCVAQFKERIVGSYVVDTPRGTISIIVVTDKPKEIGLVRMAEKTGYDQSFWQGSYAQNNIVTVRLGGYSYCAVGEISKIPHQNLKDLLNRLLPNTQR